MEQELINDYNAGIKLKKLEEKYNVSIPTIYNILRKNNIERVRDKGLKVSRDIQKQILTEYFLLHKTQKQIAELYNISEITVRLYILKYKKTILELGFNEFIKTWE